MPKSCNEYAIAAKFVIFTVMALLFSKQHVLYTEVGVTLVSAQLSEANLPLLASVPSTGQYFVSRSAAN